MPEPTLAIATCLWQPNSKSQEFSTCYDESWVEKLYRGFRRNLTLDFKFVCYTDKKYSFSEPVIQVALGDGEPGYGSMVEPFRMEGPLIVVGLDTIIVGKVDGMARYCFADGPVVLPRDPYQLDRSINGVALVPRGHRRIFDEWAGGNDMEHLRRYDWKAIDDLWPGWVVSLKAHDVRRRGLREARVVYFHGNPKPNHLTHLDWVREHWR